MAKRMASAMANAMAKPVRFRWQNDAPNPNPNPNSRLALVSKGSSGQFQIQTTRYVTRETATLGLGGEA